MFEIDIKLFFDYRRFFNKRAKTLRRAISLIIANSITTVRILDLG